LNQVSYNENVLEKDLMDNNNPKKEFQLGLFGRPCKLQPQKKCFYFYFLLHDILKLLIDFKDYFAKKRD
jgi:hypothetical protein